MTRNHFLRIGLSALVLASSNVALGNTGLTKLTSETSPLESWKNRYKALTTDSFGTTKITAKLPINQLESAMHELSDICDNTLLCEGSHIKGTVAGKKFLLQLSA